MECVCIIDCDRYGCSSAPCPVNESDELEKISQLKSDAMDGNDGKRCSMERGREKSMQTLKLSFSDFKILLVDMADQYTLVNCSEESRSAP